MLSFTLKDAHMSVINQSEFEEWFGPMEVKISVSFSTAQQQYLPQFEAASQFKIKEH